MADWTPLHTQVHRSLRQRQLLSRDDRILVAVSGGQDSLCLAKLLLDLQLKWGWQLAVAHCDHRWRADSGANAEYVEKLTHSWQLPFFLQIAPIDLPQSEAQARQWRYEALSAIAEREKYPTIVTGHTASDRAETLLFNLMRGTGADGLQALTWQRTLAPGIQLVRPLLEVSRIDTGQFCRESGIRVWDDATNSDLKYSRNRIRHELLPYLKTHFNPAVEKHLAQTAELLRADVEYLEAQADRLLQASLSHKDINVNNPIDTNCDTELVRINRRLLAAAPLAIQRRALRQLLQQVLPEAPSFDHVEKLTQLISAPNRSRTDPFPGGAIAGVEGSFIKITYQFLD